MRRKLRLVRWLAGLLAPILMGVVVGLIVVAAMIATDQEESEPEGAGLCAHTVGDETNVEDFVVETLRTVAQRMGVDESVVLTGEHVLGAMAFGIGEGGNLGNQWTYNLWNTGYSGPEVELNTDPAGNGTQGYASFADGVLASAITMTGSNQDRLALTLVDPTTDAEDFLYALTHFEAYPGNRIWAEDSDDDPEDGVGDYSYYQSRLSFLSTLEANYEHYATLQMGPPGNSSSLGLHVGTPRYTMSEGTLTGSASCGTGTPSDGVAWPMENPVVTSPWGWRINPIYGTSELHDGLDLGKPCGTPVLAAANGTVTSAAGGCVYNGYPTVCNGGWGNMIRIDHGDIGGQTIATGYNHLQDTPLVSAGDTVTQGQVIGYEGSTGSSTGCHLHFQTWVNGTNVDPMTVLPPL
jgi:hypothetical protein